MKVLLITETNECIEIHLNCMRKKIRLQTFQNFYYNYISFLLQIERIHIPILIQYSLRSLRYLTFFTFSPIDSIIIIVIIYHYMRWIVDS